MSSDKSYPQIVARLVVFTENGDIIWTPQPSSPIEFKPSPNLPAIKFPSIVKSIYESEKFENDLRLLEFANGDVYLQIMHDNGMPRLTFPDVAEIKELLRAVKRQVGGLDSLINELWPKEE